MFNSYELTGDPQYFAMAKLYLLNQEYFDPLAQGRNCSRQARLQPRYRAQFRGQAYEVMGDEKYLSAIRNAWDMLEETQQFAAGAGARGGVRPPHEGKLGESLTATASTSKRRADAMRI